VAEVLALRPLAGIATANTIESRYVAGACRAVPKYRSIHP
jgi:hypothetical protein